jgi:hypothetical protein
MIECILILLAETLTLALVFGAIEKRRIKRRRG